MASRTKAPAGSTGTAQSGLPVRSVGGWTMRTVSKPSAKWKVLPRDARTRATESTRQKVSEHPREELGPHHEGAEATMLATEASAGYAIESRSLVS